MTQGRGRRRRASANRWRQLAHPECSHVARARVAAILRGQHWKHGPRWEHARSGIAKAVGVPAAWVLPTASCTAALALAHHLLGGAEHGPRRWEVPALTYSATFAALPREHVVFCDCDDRGNTLWEGDPEAAQLAVDLWGRSCTEVEADLSELRILDAAHRFAGPEHRALVELGVMVAYSFGPMKEVATPNGGALVWRRLEEPHIEAEADAFIHYGQRGRVPTFRGGINGYMTEDRAGLLLCQLTAHESRKARRQDLLRVYHNYLGELLMTQPGEASGHLAVVRLPDMGTRLRVQNRLEAVNVQSGIHYPVAPSPSIPGASDLSERILTLPCHTLMQPIHAAKISKIVLTA